MISIEYKNNEIEIKTEELPSYVNAPLTAKIVNPISNKVIWQTNELNSNCWAKFPNTEIFSTLIFLQYRCPTPPNLGELKRLAPFPRPLIEFGGVAET